MEQWDYLRPTSCKMNSIKLCQTSSSASLSIDVVKKTVGGLRIWLGLPCFLPITRSRKRNTSTVKTTWMSTRKSAHLRQQPSNPPRLKYGRIQQRPYPAVEKFVLKFPVSALWSESRSKCNRLIVADHTSQSCKKISQKITHFWVILLTNTQK